MMQPDLPLFSADLGERWESLKPHLHKAYLEVVAELTDEKDISDEELGRKISAARTVWTRITNKMAQLESAPSKPKHQRLNRTP